MNTSVIEAFEESIIRNCVTVLLGLTIVCINGTFVFTFFQSSVFYRDPRYILYVHLVLNDMLMICVTVSLMAMSYAVRNLNISFCFILLILASTTYMNSPLILAGMAVERYIAICKPLHYPNICTVRRVYTLICLIWGVGCIPVLTDVVIFVVIHPFSIFNTVALCTSRFVYSSTYHDEKNKVVQGIYMSFVWVILIYTYFKVLVTAKKMSTDKASARKAQSTILLHAVQLLLCMMSYTTPVLDTVLVLIMPAYWKHIVFFSYIITNMVPRLLSPLIYGVRDQMFAKHMRKNFLQRFLIIKIEPGK